MKTLLYAAILGAGLWIITEVLEMASPTGSTTLSLWMTTLWHPILALGFWGLHKSQAREKNTLSLVGALLIILSFLVFAPASLIMINASIDSFSAFLQQYPVYQVVGLVSLIGNLLFGIAMIRTRFYPAWMGFSFLLALLLGMVQNFAQLPEVVQHIAFIWMSIVIINMAFFGLYKLRK